MGCGGICRQEIDRRKYPQVFYISACLVGRVVVVFFFFPFQTLLLNMFVQKTALEYRDGAFLQRKRQIYLLFSKIKTMSPSRHNQAHLLSIIKYLATQAPISFAWSTVHCMCTDYLALFGCEI